MENHHDTYHEDDRKRRSDIKRINPKPNVGSSKDIRSQPGSAKSTPPGSYALQNKENQLYEKSQENLKEHMLQIEYKLLQKFAPHGVYVVPEVNNNPRIWDCAMFVRQGLYKDAMLKFEITFPLEYPYQIPTARFISKVYHPLVNYETGEIDLSIQFQKWVPGKNLVVEILKYIHQMLMNRKYYTIDTSFNKEAAKRFAEKTDFMKIIQKCIKESEENMYNNPSTASLRFTEKADAHEAILANLTKRKEETELAQKEGFKNWFLNTYVKTLENDIENQQNS